MVVNASHVYRDLEAGKWKPFYLIVGEEPFQGAELASRIKKHFIRNDDQAAFLYETLEAEGLSGNTLLGALETLPGLFDEPGSARLVVCRRFEKINAGALEVIDPYLRDPSPSTCFVIQAAKADKRKSWYKLVEEKGDVVEVNEPHEREWPKWLAFFEKRIQKRIESEAWEIVVESCQRSLSVVASEMDKISVYLAEHPMVTKKDALTFLAPSGSIDVFSFSDDVVSRKVASAYPKFLKLIRGGESEIKLLAILVRQFRQVSVCRQLMDSGVTDTKVLAQQVGAPPFFIPKLQGQAKQHSTAGLNQIFAQLAECDFRMKTGDGKLFENFLGPYFSGLGKVSAS